jgi:tetratricopeptide (TPR) repeat protein
VEVTREQVEEAFGKDHAATTVLLAARWLQAHPDDLWITFKYAEMLYLMTRYEEAVGIYEDALHRFEDHRWAIFNQLGRLYRYRGRMADAEVWFRKAIEADPGEVASYVFLGACQARQGKLTEAEATHRAATEQVGGSLLDEAYHNLGLVLRGQGRLVEAAECFRKAVELTPAFVEGGP